MAEMPPRRMTEQEIQAKAVTPENGTIPTPSTTFGADYDSENSTVEPLDMDDDIVTEEDILYLVTVAMLVTFLVLLMGFLFALTVYRTTSSPRARFYSKWAAFSLGSIVFGSVFIPSMIFRPRQPTNALLPAWGARKISQILGIRWRLWGKENLVKDSGAIVLLNHQSCLDLLCLAELWPVIERCAVISKKEIFYIWPFGLAAYLWGTIFIDRLNGEKAQSTINSTAKYIQDKKTRLLMFPEGTRHGGEHLLPFKKGAFHVAIASQVPIQPVIVSRYYFLDCDKEILDSGSVRVNILPPIKTEGLTKDDIGQLMDETYKTMEAAYQKLNAEVAQMRRESANELST